MRATPNYERAMVGARISKTFSIFRSLPHINEAEGSHVTIV